jgi:hypothetical protein
MYQARVIIRRRSHAYAQTSALSQVLNFAVNFFFYSPPEQQQHATMSSFADKLAQDEKADNVKKEVRAAQQSTKNRVVTTDRVPPTHSSRPHATLSLSLLQPSVTN